MTLAETLLLDYDTEIANTRRTVERVPADKADWAPHAKSMKLGKLAMHCATLPAMGLYVIQDPGMDMAAPTRPRISMDFESTAAALAALDEHAATTRAAIAAASDADLLQLWPFSVGPNVISNLSRYLTLRLWFLNHLIHHTAQLGVYLRLLDIPVPGLYGPSADEQFPGL
jgi:uncharacterized damage-inducible protein DinB